MAGMSVGLCATGLPWTAGFVGAGTPRGNPRPLGPLGLMDLAARLGLSSVELPPRGMPADDRLGKPEDLGAAAAERGLALVISSHRASIAPLLADCEFAAAAGAKVVRCILSPVLCGDRRALGPGGWGRVMTESAAILKEVAPAAGRLGVRIGVENHQDATSDDLVRLCETVGDPAIGVTLDTGNPLAVAEDPVEFARRVLPHLVNVHLKDYRIVKAPGGFRLAHCAIGAGVVDFPALFDLFDRKPEVRRNLEMAWLGERHVRVLEEGWWDGYPPRPARDIVAFLRLWHARGEEGEWRSPWDAGDDVEMQGGWEMARLREGAKRMLALAASRAAAGAPA
jgi:sugar phosphate isomerase/epimerase